MAFEPLLDVVSVKPMLIVDPFAPSASLVKAGGRDGSGIRRMTSATVSEVTDRFVAEASLLEISLTECPLYKAMAASMIVGVGW